MLLLTQRKALKPLSLSLVSSPTWLLLSLPPTLKSNMYLIFISHSLAGKIF